MPTKIETLERVLLYKALADEGNLEKLQKILDEVIEEARSQRGVKKEE